MTNAGNKSSNHKLCKIRIVCRNSVSDNTFWCICKKSKQERSSNKWTETSYNKIFLFHSGPSTFKFRTRSFRGPGIFRVVARARNHVPTDKRHLVERSIINVGRKINKLSALRVAGSNDNVLLNNQNNTVVALVNG